MIVYRQPPNLIPNVSAHVSNGLDINAKNPGSGQTPLMMSVLGGHAVIVKALLELGADVTIPEKDGYTPLHGAGFQGRAEIAKMLIKHGIDINGTPHSGTYKIPNTVFDDIFHWNVFFFE